jgi:hypothetical protein
MIIYRFGFLFHFFFPFLWINFLGTEDRSEIILFAIVFFSPVFSMTKHLGFFVAIFFLF